MAISGERRRLRQQQSPINQNDPLGKLVTITIDWVQGNDGGIRCTNDTCCR